MIFAGGVLLLVCGLGLALLGHVVVGAIVALLGLAACLAGAGRRMR
jgi:hypothetical protein